MTKAKLIWAALAAAFLFGAGWWLKGLQVKVSTVAQTKAQAKAGGVFCFVGCH